MTTDKFCEQFLHPLVLTAFTGVPFNDIYRGNFEGLRGPELAKLLPLRARLSPTLVGHLFLPNHFSRRQNRTQEVADQAKTHSLSRNSLMALIRTLKNFIEGLKPGWKTGTAWTDYETCNTYSPKDQQTKADFVRRFVVDCRPARIWDIGCNTGRYAQICLEAGASHAIGLETDFQTLNQAFHGADDAELAFTPIYQDLRNLSPGVGWNNLERAGMARRIGRRHDAFLALAVLHHVSLGGNVPLDFCVAQLFEFAENGVIEFIPFDDPMVRELVALRTDLVTGWNEENLKVSLAKANAVVDEEVALENGRRLIRVSKAA